MRSNVLRLICLMTCLALAVPLLAIQGGADPLSGTWTGDWGPSPSDRNRVSVDLKWDGKVLNGVVKTIGFQRPDVRIQNSTFNAATGAVHMEAEVPGERGQGLVRFIIDGKLANNSLSGSWNHDTSKGDFKLTKNGPVR